jgi:peroxiredoxin
VKPKTLADALAEIFALPNVGAGERLAAYAQAMRDLKSPFAEEYDRLVERLSAGNTGADAPKVGDRMPPFLLPDSTVRLVGLDELLASGPVVVSFNRGHWCPFCEIELTALADAERELTALKARVVSIMPERQAFTGALQANFEDRVLFLTDMDNTYALSLGLAMWVGEPIRGMMEALGLRLDEFQGNNCWFLPLPATFVIGRDARIKARFVDPNFRNRMDIVDILHALRSG